MALPPPSEAKRCGTAYDHYTVRNENFRGCLCSDPKKNGNIFKLHLFINKRMLFMFLFPSERWQFRRFCFGSISKLCCTVEGDLWSLTFLLHGRTNKGRTNKGMTSNTTTNNTNSTDTTKKLINKGWHNKNKFYPSTGRKRLFGMVGEAVVGFLGRCRMNTHYFWAIFFHKNKT